MPAFFRNNARSFAIAALIGATALSAGCYYEGGPLKSIDRFTYASTTWEPKTITLIDTRTGETLWTADVPVGKELVIDFNVPANADNSEWLPDVAEWEIFPYPTRSGQLTNTMRVPPRSARRVDVTFRPVPEMPSGAPETSASKPFTPNKPF
jgi:hypothetical protein